jgi:protein-S-isoprenylcysteine O-methyltransferase Ste14
LEKAVPRVVTFLYGVVCYAVFLGVFVYAIGFIGGFATPTTLDGAPSRALGEALAIDVALLSLFALQHSGMARPAFKRWWTRIVPEAAERSTYVLVSSLLLVALFAWWQPIGGAVWETHGWARGVVLALYGLGWAVLFYSTCLIDHFDLFGLRQVWRRMGDAPYQAPKFYTPSLYKLVRHPLYVGWLMIFWAAPTMTAAHLLFALMTTAYILVAIQLEERDLIKAFPSEYPAYRSRTPMLFPRLIRWSGGPSPEAPKSTP